jgi:hypothetical protein
MRQLLDIQESLESVVALAGDEVGGNRDAATLRDRYGAFRVVPNPLSSTRRSLGQEMGQEAPRIPADPSRPRSRENRSKPCPT